MIFRKVEELQKGMDTLIPIIEDHKSIQITLDWTALANIHESLLLSKMIYDRASKEKVKDTSANNMIKLGRKIASEMAEVNADIHSEAESLVIYMLNKILEGDYNGN